jgi:hypothetical protein
MAEVRHEQESYDCPQVGCAVNVDRKISIQRDPETDAVEKEETTGFDCNKKLTCGIGTRSGCRIIYDWSKCSYKWVEE